MAENDQNDIIQQLLEVISGGDQQGQPRNTNEILQALTKALGDQGGGVDTATTEPDPPDDPVNPAPPPPDPPGGIGNIDIPHNPYQFYGDLADPNQLLSMMKGGPSYGEVNAGWAPITSPEAAQGLFGALGQAAAAQSTASARAYAEPLSAFIRETLSGRSALDVRREEGTQKRLTELGAKEVPVMEDIPGAPPDPITGKPPQRQKIDPRTNRPITELKTALTEDDPYGTGVVAAQVAGELAKQKQAAGLKTGTMQDVIDPITGLPTGEQERVGGTIWAEAEAAGELEESKQAASRKTSLGTDATRLAGGEIAAKSLADIASIQEKGKESRLSMADHGSLLETYGKKAQERLTGAGSPESLLVSLFGGSYGGGGEGTGGGGEGTGGGGEGTGGGGGGMPDMGGLQAMLTSAGQGGRQHTAMNLLSGSMGNPFSAPVNDASNMVGGQNNIQQLQGGFNTAAAGNLAASQQAGAQALGAGQNLFGQYSPQISNLYGMQRPLAGGAGQTIGGKAQVLGNLIGGMGRVGAG